MHSYNDLLKIINSELNKLNFDKEPQNLYQPINYVIKNGGKRIRPVLTLMSCELFGGDYKNAVSSALAIEIFHNFTLLHDDMMDNADVRRGNPTVHIKWNDNIALLSGDAMSIIAYKLISESPVNLTDILNTFSNTALNICEGQQYDMDFEDNPDVSEEEYIKMITLKTAVLLACSLRIGALSANAKQEDCENIYEFGKNLGTAFQLQDDFLDVYGDTNKFGKNIGGDIILNKKTFLLIKALKEAKGQDYQNLIHWINAKDFNNQEKINAVITIFNNLNIKEYTLQNMEKYYNKAYEIFDKIPIENERKKVVIDFAESLRRRDC